MRLFLCLVVLSGSVRADQIEEASRALAGKIAMRIPAQERAHLVVRNISRLTASEAAHARAVIETALPKRSRARSVADVSVTFSENAGGYLWVAEMHKGEVEMVAFRSNAPTAVPATQLLTKRFVWQQNETLLDFVQQGDRIVLLNPGTVVVMQGGQRTEAAIDVPRVRDARGRLEVGGNVLTAYFPGATCRGTEEPLHLDCDGQSADFVLNGEKVRFTPGRNTLTGSGTVKEGTTVCGGMNLAIVKENVVALLGKNGAPVDQTELPGLVTALWPTAEGAAVVIRNPDRETSMAYALSVDCGVR